MGLFKPDAPTPPNAVALAGAQTSTNVNTAVANAFLNNTNQSTPQGSLNYDPTGSFSWTDPTTGQNYNIPRFTATQTLSPAQQNISNLGVSAETNLAGLAANQSGQLENLLGSPMDTSQAPIVGQAGWLNNIGIPQFDLGDSGQQETTFGDAGDIATSYGPGDFSADRDKVEQALYQRMDPQLQRDRASMEARLADQGIKMGSPGWQTAEDQFSNQLTDTRLAITAQAGQEQQRMMDMAAQRAGFQNAAQMQQYTQQQGRGTFANQAQAQQFQQKALQGQFFNAAQAQEQARVQNQFNAANTQRANALSEAYAQRNQPINEITALMSGSQVQHPSFVNTPTNQIPTTDVAGLVNNQFSQNFQNFQQANTNFNSLMGGIFGMMGGLARSDRRVKENVHRIGTVFAAKPDAAQAKLPIYQYSFKDDPASVAHVGPMAQDVEKIDPDAVQEHGGTKYIDTTRVMGSILKAA
jgi:hypothetical protein